MLQKTNKKLSWLYKMLLKLHFKKFYKKIALKAVKVFLKPFEASQRSVKTKI